MAPFHGLETSVNVAITQAVVSMFSLVFTGIMAYFTAKLNVKVDTAAVKREEAIVKVEEVKQTIDDTKLQVAKKLNEIQRTIGT